MSNNIDKEYFCDGLTEEIINMLAKAELSETRIVFFREGSDFIEEN